MPASPEEHSRMTFADLRRDVESKLGTGDWVTLYEFDDNSEPRRAFYCALVGNDYVGEVLDDPSWDLRIGDGVPTFEGSEENSRHFSRVAGRSLEPLVHRRYFPGPREPYNELSEEFRLFHNLFEDRKRSGRYFQFDDTAEEVPVATVAPELVRVRMRWLKEYLSVRDMSLLLFFEYDRHSAFDLNALGIGSDGIREEVRDENLVYRYVVDAFDSMSLHPGGKTLGRLLGKKLVRGYTSLRGGRFTQERQFEAFIIGMDDDGNDVQFPCNDDLLANDFGKNPGSPNYLTPIFFRRDVLGKYYADARRYEVRDSHVFCGGAWSLRLDNNHPDYVIVWLGDLGHLPHKEQLYWRSFNIVPEGAISNTYRDRSILGLWVEPEAPDLLFKSRYQRFRHDWAEKFGWDLFKPLHAADGHTFETLHVPSDENQADFDTQTMSLAKVLIERLNDAELGRRVELASNDKSITKLEKFLTMEGFLAAGTRLALLRNLQDLRSGPAHVKGKAYERAAAYFEVDDKGHNAAFSDMLRSANEFIGGLAKHFELGWEPPEGVQELLDAMK